MDGILTPPVVRPGAGNLEVRKGGGNKGSEDGEGRKPRAEHFSEIYF